MLFGSHITWKQLAGFSRRVGTSLEAGVAVLNCFDRERNQAKGNFRQVLSEIRDELAVGETLADAVAHQGEQFPLLYCEMLRVGEETGHTGRLMLKMATHYEKLIQLRRIVLNALLMPGLQLTFSLGVVGLLIWIVGVIPSGSGAPIDILGLGLVGNRGLLIYFMVLGGIALGLLGLITEWRRGRLGANAAIELLMKVPAIGTFIETAALYADGLGLVNDNRSWHGRTAKYADGAQCTNLNHYEKHAAAIDASIKAGNPLHEAISATHAFSAEFVGVVEVGEQSGRLSESLEHLFQQYEDRADALANGLATAATFAVWGLVAAFIVFLIFRIASFYIGTINSFLP